jgi:hypothetical protein
MRFNQRGLDFSGYDPVNASTDDKPGDARAEQNENETFSIEVSLGMLKESV